MELIDEKGSCKIDSLNHKGITDFIEDHIDLFFPNRACFAMEWKVLKGLEITNDSNNPWNPEYFKVVFNNGSELFCDIADYGPFQSTTIEIRSHCTIQSIT